VGEKRPNRIEVLRVLRLVATWLLALVFVYLLVIFLGAGLGLWPMGDR
jgi:hypothetical protein